MASVWIMTIMICSPRQMGGRVPICSESCGRVVLMSIYKEFMIILTTVNVIIAILTYLHKK